MTVSSDASLPSMLLIRQLLTIKNITVNDPARFSAAILEVGTAVHCSAMLTVGRLQSMNVSCHGQRESASAFIPSRTILTSSNKDGITHRVSLPLCTTMTHNSTLYVNCCEYRCLMTDVCFDQSDGICKLSPGASNGIPRSVRGEAVLSTLKAVVGVSQDQSADKNSGT